MTKPCQCPWLYDIIVFVFLGDGFLPLAGSLELHHVVLHVPNAEGRVMTALAWRRRWANSARGSGVT